MLPNVRAVGHVGSMEHNEFNASARCVLNVTRDSMATNGWTPPARVFEAAGAGACVITDAWPGVETFFQPGDEILLASSAEEIVSCLFSLNAAHSARIGAAMRARALRDHTYALRARQVDSILRSAEQPAAQPQTTAAA